MASSLACLLRCVRLFVILMTVACQDPLSMEFPRQEYCSRLPFPSPGNHPDPGTEPESLVSPALAGRFLYLWKPHRCGIPTHTHTHTHIYTYIVYMCYAQSCPTLCNPMDIAHQALLSMGFFQSRILEWGAISYSRGSS